MQFPSISSQRDVRNALNLLIPKAQILSEGNLPGNIFLHFNTSISIDIPATLKVLQAVELDLSGRKLLVFFQYLVYL